MLPKGEYIQDSLAVKVWVKPRIKLFNICIDKGCDYIILVEDDMKFSDNHL